MKKLIGIVAAIIIVVLMALAFVAITRRTTDEGKAVIETSRKTVDKAKDTADEMNKRTSQINRDMERTFEDEKK